MPTSQTLANKVDLLFRIQRGAVIRFEVKVCDFFHLDQTHHATVSISSDAHVCWDSRQINNAEYQSLRNALECINIQGVPRVTRKLDGNSYLLEINSPHAYGCYQWWGDLPGPWSSLKRLIEALQRLALEK